VSIGVPGGEGSFPARGAWAHMGRFFEERFVTTGGYYTGSAVC